MFVIYLIPGVRDMGAKRIVYQSKEGNKRIVVYEDDSVEEIIEEHHDIVTSICHGCGRVECVCKDRAEGK